MPPVVPPEVLDDIFALLKPWAREFYPSTHLHPVRLVNRAWGDVAERRLYASISVGSDDNEAPVLGADQAKLLAQTLEGNARLADIPREVRLGTMSCDRDETEAHWRILVACKYITHLTLEGYNGYVLGELKDSIQNLRYLKSFTVSRYSLSDLECDGFCSVDELIVLLMGWPDIEEIIFHNSTTTLHCLCWPEGQDDQFREPDWLKSLQVAGHDPETVQKWREKEKMRARRDAVIRAKILDPPLGYCPRLRVFDVRDSVAFDAPLMDALRVMAPAIEKFVAEANLFTQTGRAAARRALLGWAQSLTHLSMNPESLGGPDVFMDDNLCLYLNQVTILNGNIHLLKATSLGLFPSLQILTFRVMDSFEVDQLTDTLQRMQSLTALYLRSMRSRYDVRTISLESLAMLRKACIQRNIHFDCYV